MSAVSIWLLLTTGLGIVLSVLTILVVDPVRKLRENARRPEMSRRGSIVVGLVTVWIASPIAALIVVVFRGL
jgi:hypothetical protein